MKPNPVLTDEEIIEKFGVVNSDMVDGHNTVLIIEYVTNGENKISFAWMTRLPNENGSRNIYDYFTNNVLFTAEAEALKIGLPDWNDSFVKPANEHLGDAKVISIYTPAEIREYFEKRMIYIPDSEHDAILKDEYGKGESTILEIARMYAIVIPEEYWVTWEDLGYVTSDVKVA